MTSAAVLHSVSRPEDIIIIIMIIERLRARRAAHRTQVTRYVNKEKELLGGESTNPTHLASVRDGLIARKLELQRFDEEFEAAVPIHQLVVEYAAAAEYTG